jgi:hypothetical protein
MIPKQTTIAFAALCYRKDRPKLSFAEERSWEGRYQSLGEPPVGESMNL